MNSPLVVLEKLDKVRSETMQRLNNLSQEHLNYKPPNVKKEEWSLGEVFMHLALDEIYLRELIAIPLIEGVKPPDDLSFLPPPPPYGMQKEVIKFWFIRARRQTRSFLENWPEDANLKLTHDGGLKSLNGLQWFEGYAGHEAYHHNQIERLISKLP
jgi:hypothetical protein